MARDYPYIHAVFEDAVFDEKRSLRQDSLDLGKIERLATGGELPKRPGHGVGLEKEVERLECPRPLRSGEGGFRLLLLDLLPYQDSISVLKARKIGAPSPFAAPSLPILEDFLFLRVHLVECQAQVVPGLEIMSQASLSLGALRDHACAGRAEYAIGHEGDGAGEGGNGLIRIDVQCNLTAHFFDAGFHRAPGLLVRHGRVFRQTDRLTEIRFGLCVLREAQVNVGSGPIGDA